MTRPVQTLIATFVGGLAGALFGGFGGYLLIFVFSMLGLEEDSYRALQMLVTGAVISAAIMATAWRLEPLYLGLRPRRLSTLVGAIGGGIMALVTGVAFDSNLVAFSGLFAGLATGALAGLLIGLRGFAEFDQKPDQSREWDEFYKRKAKEQ